MSGRGSCPASIQCWDVVFPWSNSCLPSSLRIRGRKIISSKRNYPQVKFCFSPFQYWIWGKLIPPGTCGTPQPHGGAHLWNLPPSGCRTTRWRQRSQRCPLWRCSWAPKGLKHRELFHGSVTIEGGTETQLGYIYIYTVLKWWCTANTFLIALLYYENPKQNRSSTNPQCLRVIWLGAWG